MKYEDAFFIIYSFHCQTKNINREKREKNSSLTICRHPPEDMTLRGHDIE